MTDSFMIYVYTCTIIYMKKNLLRLKICYLKIIKKMYEKDFKYLEPMTSKLNNKQQYTDKSRNDEKNCDILNFNLELW